MLKYFKKGILHYWYTGEKKIAITGGIVGTILNFIVLFLTVGSSAFALVLMLLMDHLLIIFILLYVIVLRNIIPIKNLVSMADEFFIENIIFLILGWLLNRLITNFIAEKYFKYKLK